MLNFDVGVGCGSQGSDCLGSGCEAPPDFCIKRGDSRPSYKVSMEDCDGAVDISDENLVIDASMWFDAKLKSAVDSSSSTISFADNIGLERVAIGDVVVVLSPRSVERMLVLGVDESAKVVSVERGYGSTTPRDWPKGSGVCVFRFIDEPAEAEVVLEQFEEVDGTVSERLAESFAVFNWRPEHTSVPGCYWLEFKFTMMDGSSIAWTKRVPLSRRGFLVNIVDTPTNN